jgi:hypothetical protein
MKLGHWLFKGHLDDDEYILEVVHRHPLVLKYSSYKTMLLGITAPIVVYFLFPKFLLICIIWFAVGFCGMIYHFFDWYFDAWLLTNQGVIDVQVNGLFDKSSARIEYHMIEGIGYTVKGVLQTLFNYGNVTIDKLGANTSIVLEDAPNPKKVEKKVMYYQEKFLRSKSIRDHNALKNMLSDMIAYHVQNNKIDDPTKD